MDTDTVLKIIEMLDHRTMMLENLTSGMPNSAYHMGRLEALSDFSDTLQEYIHSLQNQVENEMNRGE